MSKTTWYGSIILMLQVLTGSAKGKKLKVPKGTPVRPTTSRVRTSIFDTLGSLAGLNILDIFSGAGGLGIEALSRGAERATFVEINPRVMRALKENISNCGFGDRVELICSHYKEALGNLKNKGDEYDLIFVDPPYFLYEELTVNDLILAVSPLLCGGGTVVVKHDYKFDTPPEGFVKSTRPFGQTHVSYFHRGEG